MWRILTRLCITKINIYSVGLPKELCKWSPRLNEDNPLGGVVFNKSKSLVSCTRTCQDPVGHTSNSTVTTCADGITEHTEDEGLSVNICCSSASALCQTGNNDGKSSNFPSYLYHRKIQSVEPVSLERSDFEGQQENSGKQDEEEDGMLEYDSPSDDNIPPVEWEAYFYLGRYSRLGRSIHFNSRIVFSYFFLISVVMKPWDCRDLLCFMHLLKLLFVSLILTCLYPYVWPWSKFNERKSLPRLAYVIRAKLWKLLKWTISSFWWKEINSRLTVTIDVNGSMLAKKIITHQKGPSKFRKWAKTKLYDRDRDWPV